MNISDAKVGDPAVIYPGNNIELYKFVVIESVGKNHVVADGRKWTMRGKRWGSDGWYNPSLEVGDEAIGRAKENNKYLMAEKQLNRLVRHIDIGRHELRKLPVESLEAIAQIIADAKAKEQPPHA